MLKSLLSNRSGVDVNEQSGWYGSALQAALAKGHNEIVQLLLKREADMNVQCGHYGSALQVVLVNSYNEIVQLLLEEG